MLGGVLMLVLGFAACAVALVVYFLPGIIASRRGHPNTMPVLVVNFFFGWTLLGWVGALAWSLSSIPGPVPRAVLVSGSGSNGLSRAVAAEEA